MWMRWGNGESEVKCPDGWRSAMSFSRLGGIKNNHCLTPKPEGSVCVQGQLKSRPSLLQTSAAGRGTADFSLCVRVCVFNGLTFSLLKARAGAQHLSF